MDYIVNAITYITMLSVAAERFVDIFKRIGLEKFNLNGVSYQVLSAAFGVAIAYISPPPFMVGGSNQMLSLLVCGLLVSGGSSAWNSVLAILKNSSLLSALSAIQLPVVPTSTTTK